MQYRKLISAATAAFALIGSMAGVTVIAAETQTIAEWSSDFNVSVAAETETADAYQAKYGETIFGKFQAAGKNDDTAKNAGLNLRMTPSDSASTTTGIGKVSAGANYLVKLASSASDANYGLGVLGTTATLESGEGISLSGGKTFEMSYDTYAVYKNGTASKTTTVTLRDADNSELVSYTYNSRTGNITAVKFGGTQPSDFAEVSACSLTSKSATLGTLTDLTIDSATSHKNARITLSVSADGTASLSVIRDAKSGETEGINKTYTGTVSTNTVIKSFTISNGSGEDGSRAYTIDNLNTTVTSPDAPTPTPVITEAQKYNYTNDETLANKDTAGFVAEISGTVEASSSLTWYIKKSESSNYKELTSGILPNSSSGEVKTLIGLILYNFPENVSADNISVGYSVSTPTVPSE